MKLIPYDPVTKEQTELYILSLKSERTLFTKRSFLITTMQKYVKVVIRLELNLSENEDFDLPSELGEEFAYEENDVIVFCKKSNNLMDF